MWAYCRHIVQLMTSRFNLEKDVGTKRKPPKYILKTSENLVYLNIYFASITNLQKLVFPWITVSIIMVKLNYNASIRFQHRTGWFAI